MTSYLNPVSSLQWTVLQDVSSAKVQMQMLYWYELLPQKMVKNRKFDENIYYSPACTDHMQVKISIVLQNVAISLSLSVFIVENQFYLSKYNLILMKIILAS